MIRMQVQKSWTDFEESVRKILKGHEETVSKSLALKEAASEDLGEKSEENTAGGWRKENLCYIVSKVSQYHALWL